MALSSRGDQLNVNTRMKNLTIVGAAIVSIVGSCLWIYFTHFKASQQNVELHRKIGEVLAEQTANAVGKKAKIVVLTIDIKEWPELKIQIDGFKAALKRLGDYEVRDSVMDTKDQPKYGVGTGLSGGAICEP